jgi:flagellin
MIINTNVQALRAAGNLLHSQDMLAKSLGRLSSGSKIVTPSDDAAGLAVGARLDSQIRRTEAAKTNCINAISYTQTQDGYLVRIAKALDRMSELSMLAQDVTKGDADRTLYQTEYTQLSDYITDMGTKDFNGVSLFASGSLMVTLDSEGNGFTMSGINIAATDYTAATHSNISTLGDARSTLAIVKSAITKLATDRATIGAYQSRLNATVDQLTISRENLTAANSRIQDVDVADESTQYARYNILVQTGTAMLAQANQLPSSVLRLLQ